MSSMSRSARTRANRRAPINRATPARVTPAHLTPATPDPITGPGARRGSVHYSGSGDSGHRSEWSRTPYFVTPVTVDIRWSK
jgi:hypothetical protein